MIMKRHRLHPEMGHSMHYIRLVKGEKHCTQRVIELENIVVENNAFHVCISLFLCTVKHLFVSSPKNIHTALKQTAQESSAGSHLQVQVSSTIWRETSIQEAR